MNPIQPEVADALTREHRQRRMKRVQIGMAVFVMCIGLVNFLSVTGKPRFKTYHTLDVIRLMIAGAGVGVALVLLCFKPPGSRSETRKE